MSTTIYIVYLIYLLLCEPILRTYTFRKFSRKSNEHTNARSPYYLSFIAWHWIPTVILLLFVASGSPEFTDIGLTLPVLDTGLLPIWITYIVLAVASLLLLLAIYQWLAPKTDPRYRKIIRQIQPARDLDMLPPETPKEKRLAICLSLSAAVCEELLYRGLLIFILTALSPAINVYECIATAGVIYGIARTYRGVSDIIKTTAYGILLSALYMSVGSVLPGMLWHLMIQLGATDCTRAIINTGNTNNTDL